MIKTINIQTQGQGLYEFTDKVVRELNGMEKDEGLCHLFVRHTSCSLIIQENADPSAKKDLENWMNRLVKENDPLYTHIFEGADDMPAHIKSVLTNSQLSIPYQDGKLMLGTWQGIYLWEHRHQSHNRQVVLHY